MSTRWSKRDVGVDFNMETPCPNGVWSISIISLLPGGRTGRCPYLNAHPCGAVTTVALSDVPQTELSFAAHPKQISWLEQSRNELTSARGGTTLADWLEMEFERFLRFDTMPDVFCCFWTKL